jgi:hypothetical protein
MLNNSVGEVFILKTAKRAAGVKNLLSQFGLGEFSGKHVALKANFNDLPVNAIRKFSVTCFFCSINLYLFSYLH